MFLYAMGLSDVCDASHPAQLYNLSACLAHHSTPVVDAAVEALGRHPHPRSEKELLKLLDQPTTPRNRINQNTLMY